MLPLMLQLNTSSIYVWVPTHTPLIGAVQASAWASLHGEAMNAIRIEARRCRALTWRAVHGDAAGTMSLMASGQPHHTGLRYAHPIDPLC